MGLAKMSATVYLYGEQEGDEPRGPFTVSILHQDRLRAELVTSRIGIDPEQHQQALAASWAWAAMKREGHYDQGLEPFLWKDSADVELETDKDPETGADLEVTPTTEGQPPA